MITPLETMQTMTQPEEITLSGWRRGQEITVMVQKPNFYALLARGSIPNPLIPEMDKLFVRRDRKGYAEPDIKFATTLVTIAELTLVEPSYQQLTDAGVELTDDQLTELSIYATSGAEALATFRDAVRLAAGKHEQAVQATAQPASASGGSVQRVVPGRGDRAPAAAAGAQGQAAPAEGDEQSRDAEAAGD